MKKLIMLLSLLLCGSVLATDVYDFKAKIRVPELNAGVRTYKTAQFKGYLYVDYTENGEVSSAQIEAKNSRSGVTHFLVLDEFLYGILGKSNKKAVRTVPEVYMSSSEGITYNDCDCDSHELITTISLAGNGTMKFQKGYSTGCGLCGDVEYVDGCDKLSKASGNLVGRMSCECPDEVDWDHTLLGGKCGIIPGDLRDIRTSEAAIWGTWNIKWNRKLSD